MSVEAQVSGTVHIRAYPPEWIEALDAARHQGEIVPMGGDGKDQGADPAAEP